MDTLKNWFSPPDLGSYDTEQRTIVLRVSSIVAFTAGLVLGLVNASAGFDHLAISLFILAGVSAFSLWSIRRGRLIAPSFLLPLSALLVLTSNLIVGGSLQEPGVLVYPVVIVFASLLLGKRAALLFAGLSVLSLAIVFIAFSSGLVTEAVGVQESLSGLIVTSLLIGIMAVFLWIVLDSLERSVDRTRSSRARWRSVVENAPVSIIITDRHGRIQFINRVEGEAISNVLGKPLLDFIDTADYERARAISRGVLESGESTHFETIGRKFDGTEVDYSVSVGPISGADGEVEGLSFIVLDITEKKRNEVEINWLNSELERLVQERTVQLETSNQELASFSYSVSHDLRAPLRAIDGFSLVLLEDYEETLDEQGRDYLTRIRRASQRMGVLIDDLLRLARLTRQKIKTEIFDISALVVSVTDNIQATHPERQVELIIEPDLQACGDEDLLRTALDDLFINAWKFTSEKEMARIEFGCQEMEVVTTYFVRDNGMGFDMQYADKLFQPFQHLHIRSGWTGSGVGLAIVQRVIQKHGGKIWAESEEGQGATFYFTLIPS